MKIPVYVMTGFLESGKTTFLNQLLNNETWKDLKVLHLSFERGLESFEAHHEGFTFKQFSKRDYDKDPALVREGVKDTLLAGDFDEVWIEWNGVLSITVLEDILLDKDLKKEFTLKKILHLADAKTLESTLGKTGATLPEQLASSDLVLLRDARDEKEYKKLRSVIRGINPGVEVIDAKDDTTIRQSLFKREMHPLLYFGITALLLVLLHLTAKPVLEVRNVPLNRIINVFLGIMLQAIPFLLIGVLLSSLIQVFVPRRFIEKWFPKSTIGGMLVAIGAGFLLPVCDCASIPIFRSLVRKGVPLPAAITFMTATPVINPVVILSTYFAFSGHLNIVLGRIGLGIITSLIIGGVFAIRKPKEDVLTGGGLDRLMCSCGCYEDMDNVEGLSGKLSLFIRHSQAEFFDVGRYLLLGTFIATLIQVFGTGFFTSISSGAGLAFFMLLLMLMAFLLSLCSSSDAVIARSFASQFPNGAIMAFLVFGPMMDIKNIILLRSGFEKKFIATLLAVAAVVCFSVIFVLYSTGVLS